ncbi:MAG TPA: hypothetical protein VNZ94_12170 [Xanthobacteraceae bacterium]|nr:hypothetical protein [Xanthobacteraceae bacterium]
MTITGRGAAALVMAYLVWWLAVDDDRTIACQLADEATIRPPFDEGRADWI